MEVLECGQPGVVVDVELRQVAQSTEPRRQRGQLLVVVEFELFDPGQRPDPLRQRRQPTVIQIELGPPAPLARTV